MLLIVVTRGSSVKRISFRDRASAGVAYRDDIIAATFVKFADNLKRELPRIPFAPANVLSERSESKGRKSTSDSGFWAFAKAGQSLAGLHLDYEKLGPWKLKWIENPNLPLSYRVEKMKLSKDK